MSGPVADRTDDEDFVAFVTGDDLEHPSAELRVPSRDWASKGFQHRIWKAVGEDWVVFNVYEPSGLAGSKPCTETVAVAPDANARGPGQPRRDPRGDGGESNLTGRR